MRSLPWTGYRWDDTIGLYDANARFYDPFTGNFTQPDSLVPEPYNPISLNRYAYVYNSPVNLTDSSGHFIDTLWDIADLGIDLSNCLGDTDTLSCYMLPVDAAAVVVPFVPGAGDNIARSLTSRNLTNEEVSNLVKGLRKQLEPDEFRYMDEALGGKLDNLINDIECHGAALCRKRMVGGWYMMPELDEKTGQFVLEVESRFEFQPYFCANRRHFYSLMQTQAISNRF